MKLSKMQSSSREFSQSEKAGGGTRFPLPAFHLNHPFKSLLFLLIAYGQLKVISVRFYQTFLLQLG